MTKLQGLLESLLGIEGGQAGVLIAAAGEIP